MNIWQVKVNNRWITYEFNPQNAEWANYHGYDCREIEKNSVEHIAYMQTVPNSHFWTDLKQLLETIKYKPVEMEYLRIGLENSLSNGYNIKNGQKIMDSIEPIAEGAVEMLYETNSGNLNEYQSGYREGVRETTGFLLQLFKKHLADNQ